MRYAIVESGGKQYRVVEGGTLDVDRLPVEAGKELNLESILLMADGDEVMVGNPIVGGILVKTRVLAHVKGPKVVSFKYRPKKRIRVKGGHRHQYTRLMVDFIGRPGEERKREEAPKPAEVQAPAAVVPAAKAPKARATKQPAKSSKTPAKKSTTGRPPSAEKKSTAAKKTTKK